MKKEVGGSAATSEMQRVGSGNGNVEVADHPRGFWVHVWVLNHCRVPGVTAGAQGGRGCSSWPGDTQAQRWTEQQQEDLS